MITYKIPQWGIGWPDNTLTTSDTTINIKLGDIMLTSKSIFHVVVIDKETEEIILDFTVVADSEERARMKGLLVSGVDDVEKVVIVSSYLGGF